jgi:hypothetical protein
MWYLLLINFCVLLDNSALVVSKLLKSGNKKYIKIKKKIDWGRFTNYVTLCQEICFLIHFSEFSLPLRFKMGSGASYPSHGMLLNHSIAPRPVLTTAETSPLNLLYYRRRASGQAIDERTARLVATAAAASDVNAVCDQSALFDRCALMWIPHSQQFCDDGLQADFEPRDDSIAAEHADRQQVCTPKRCAWLASRSNALVRLSDRELSLGKLPSHYQVNQVFCLVCFIQNLEFLIRVVVIVQAPECLPPLSAHLPVFDAIESEYAESWRAVILGDTAPPHAVPLDPTLCLCFEAVFLNGEMTVRCVTLEEVCLICCCFVNCVFLCVNMFMLFGGEKFAGYR